MAERRRIERKKLGELLIEKGMITQDQLDMALAEQSKNGGLLGEILVGWGYTTEDSIVEALSSQYAIAFIRPTLHQTEESVISLISKEIASRHSLVGVDKIGNTLTLAMSNPLDDRAVEEVEKQTGLKTQIFITTYTEIMRCIERFYDVQKPGST